MTSGVPDPRVTPLLTPNEVAALSPLGRTAVYEAIRRGQLPSVRYGRRVFVPTAALRRAWGLEEVPSNIADPAVRVALVADLREQADRRKEDDEHGDG